MLHRRIVRDWAVVLVTIDLFPDDPLAKTFLTVRRGDAVAGQWPLDAARPGFALEGPARGTAAVVRDFVVEGIRHIAIGSDHVLFVLALILLGGPLGVQARIVTAFTLAHSVTLTLAVLGLVALPARLVESAIALSIVVVGLHDLRALLRGGGRPAPGARDPRPLLALGFGLIHGFGFATVLRGLDLPRDALAWALGAFNLGVEIGQLALVLMAAPLLALLRRRAPPAVTRDVLARAAGAVTLSGAAWLCQRALGA